MRANQQGAMATSGKMSAALRVKAKMISTPSHVRLLGQDLDVQHVLNTIQNDLIMYVNFARTDI